MDVLKKIAHRHFIFSIPKILRQVFHRALLSVIFSFEENPGKDKNRYGISGFGVCILGFRAFNVIASPLLNAHYHACQ
jgi:hypothetical protein